MANNVENFVINVKTAGAENIDKLTRNINTLNTAIIGLSFGAFIRGAMEAADRVDDLAASTGLSVGYIKGFESALQSAGGKAKNAEKIITTFYQSIETANDGSLKARDAFLAVGVSLDDLKNASEGALLDKAINQLKEMDAGSQRTALAVQLFGKSFRNVDPANFAQELDIARSKMADMEVANKAVADANLALETSFKNLQEGAILALAPIVQAFGQTGISAAQAQVAIKAVGAIMVGLYSAKMIGMMFQAVAAYKAMNGALKAQAVIQTFLTALQGPKGVAMIIAGTAAAAASYIALTAAMEDNAEAAKKANDAAKGDETGPAKRGQGAGRSQELDARQKAAIESAKNIAKSQIEIEKQGKLDSLDQIKSIEVNAQADIAKAKEDIFSKENLSKTQKAKEFAAKQQEIEAKTQAEILKIRLDAAKSADEQVSAYEQGINQIGQRISLEQQLFGVVGITAEIRKKQLEVEINASKELETLSKNLYLTDKDREDAQRRINEAKTKALAFTKEEIALADAKKLANANKVASPDAARFQMLKDLREQDKISEEEYQNALMSLTLETNDAINTSNQKRFEALKLYQLQSDKDSIFGYETQKQMSKEAADFQMKSDFEKTSFMVDNLGTLFNALGKSNKKAFEASKAIAVAQAIMNTYQGATKALATYPPPFNFVAAAAVVASGMAQVSSIKAQSYSGRALGGPVNATSPYMVGENGPELFVPKTSGQIVRGEDLGKIGTNNKVEPNITNVSYTINAVDSMSFKQMLARDPEFLHAVAETGRKQIPSKRRA